MQTFLATILPIHSWFQGHPMAGLLLLLMICDVTTGVLRSIRDHKVASDVATAGITRKAGVLLAVMVGYALAGVVPGLPVGDTLALFYVGAEGLSLIENFALLGVPVPAALQGYFTKLAENTPDKNTVKPLVAPLPAKDSE